MPTAIIVVDMQNDFVRPNGALYVPGAEKIIPNIVKAITTLSTELAAPPMLIYTLDSHPKTHSSFKEFGGEWPPHCVLGTMGRWLVPELPRRRTEYNNAPKKCIKGDNMRSAGYSAFSGLIKNEDLGPTGDRVDLLRFLSDNKINRLIICGVATDYCVNATVMDAVNLGFNVSVIENGIMGIDPAKCEEIRTIWKSNNVEFLRL